MFPSRPAVNGSCGNQKEKWRETDIYRKFRIYPTRSLPKRNLGTGIRMKLALRAFDRGVSSAATSAVLPVRRTEAQRSRR